MRVVYAFSIRVYVTSGVTSLPVLTSLPVTTSTAKKSMKMKFSADKIYYIFLIYFNVHRTHVRPKTWVALRSFLINNLTVDQ